MKYNLMKRNIICLLIAAMALTACDKDVFDINTDPFKDQTYATSLSSPIATFLT